MGRFYDHRPQPKPRLPSRGPIGQRIRIENCRRHDRVMGLATDIEAEVEFVRITAAGRVAVIYWTPFGTSYRELDADVQVKLVRREAASRGRS
jgi:hypothetical protein